MSDKSDPNIRRCKRCRALFRTEEKRYICPECRNRVQYQEGMPSEQRSIIYKEMQIVRFVNALDRFNQRIGTDYSYGQAVALLKEGKIEKAELFR